MPAIELDTRAVTFAMGTNEAAECDSCHTDISFNPPKSRWVLANVYGDCECQNRTENGLPCRSCGGRGRKWTRVEHWHPSCYDAASAPYGAAEFRQTVISKATSW